MTDDYKPVLYSFPLSANGYRARLVLDYLGVSFEARTVDLSKGEQLGPDFLKINPLGQLPVLVDGDLTLWDSHAIIAYLADRYRGPAAESIWPSAAAERAQIAKWMYFDAVELHFGIGLARNHHAFGVALDVASAERRALKALGVLERRLESERLARIRPSDDGRSMLLPAGVGCRRGEDRPLAVSGRREVGRAHRAAADPASAVARGLSQVAAGRRTVSRTTLAGRTEPRQEGS